MKCNICNSENISPADTTKIIFTKNIIYDVPLHLIESDAFEDYYYGIVKEILNKYLEGIYFLSDLREAMDNTWSINYRIKYHCNSCGRTGEMDCPAGSGYYPYYSIMSNFLNQEFDHRFQSLFKCPPDFIFDILKYQEKRELIPVFFKHDDELSKKLFLIYDIYPYLPSERGGEAELDNIFQFLSNPVVLSIFANFLYDVGKSGFKKAVPKIKSILQGIDIKKGIATRQQSIQSYLESENILIDEELLRSIITEKTLEAVDQYIAIVQGERDIL
ncbi:hypothetical protein FACS189493_6760 [Spirochaetia bacterium]|nr:hypothetical protein FACS189493_6760 [Spirochaetia bacterium]